MVKISLKKESKVKKQKQKQKQKQSQTQKVVVNIGTNVLRPKRRRRTGPIEKKAINKQQTPSINVPQALPVVTQPPKESMNELIKYLKQAEQRKEAIKDREIKKTNELEKEKKEEKRSEDLTRDEVQDNFSVVYPSSNISSLTTSGTNTPLLSRPVDHNSLFEALSREADLRSENPNSGSISLSTSSSISFPTTPSTTSLLSNTSSKQTLDEVLKDTVVTAAEDPVIEKVLEEMPENQIVRYGSERVGQTSTATEQINIIDNSIPPPPPLRINKPLPTIRMSDIIAANAKPLSLTQISQKEIEREARLKALEKKKPDIEPEIPTFSKEELDQYKEQTQKASKQEKEGLKDFELKLENMTNLELGKLLKDNGIKGQSGNDFRFTTTKQVYDGTTYIAKDQLKKNLLIAFENGYLTNI